MYTISKEFHFSASHILYWLEANHPCGRMHGHNYVVIVELTGKLQENGFVKDYRELEPIKKWIDENLDHRHLNDVSAEVLGDPEAPLFVQPSAEIMASRLFDVFQKLVPDVTICGVRVKETPKTEAIYRPALVYRKTLPKAAELTDEEIRAAFNPLKHGSDA